MAARIGSGSSFGGRASWGYGRADWIDELLALVSPNAYGGGDGSQLPQLHIGDHDRTAGGGSFFQIIQRYFNDAWREASDHIWDFESYLD